LLVFFLNISSSSIAIPINKNQTPTTTSISPLRGESGAYSPRETQFSKSSSDFSTKTDSSIVTLQQTPIRYAIIDGVEDDVDSNTSDVDSFSDFGIETNFNYAQGSSVDAQFMQVQEELSSPPTIEIDSISTNSATSSYFVHNHTVSGNNRLLLVTVQTDGGTTVGNVTFGGQILTLAGNMSRTAKGFPNVEVWSLLNPPTGMAEVEVHLTDSNSDESTIGVISYTGVDQTTPIDGVTISEGFSKSPAITLSSRVGDLVQSGMASLDSGAPIPNSGQTTIWSVEMGGASTSSHYGVACVKNGSTSVTIDWSIGSTKDWVAVGVNIRRAPAPYILDLEYQWTSAEHTKLEKELAIYTGNLGAESLKVDVWSGSSTWVTVFDSLNANSWNNISVAPYMTSSTFTIRLRDTDEFTDDSSDSWNIDLILLVTSPENNKPIAENLTLSPDPLYGNDTLTLNYNYSDQDGDLESGTEIHWYKWNETGSSWNLRTAFNGEMSISSSSLYKGDTWRATVKPHDGIEFGNVSISSNITVQNLPPILSNIVVSPSNPLTTTTITVSYSYFDPDSDIEDIGNLEILWYKNGFLQVEFNDQTSVPANAINKSEIWNYDIRTFDGTNYSYWEISSNVTIGNSIPTALGVNLTANPNTNTDLTSSYTFSDNDFDAEGSWMIRWYSNNGTGDELKGYLNDVKTVKAGNTTRGEVWYYTLKVFDGTNYSILYTSPSRSIINEAPTASDISITSDPYTINDLQANWFYSDFENDSEGVYIITWYKNGILYTNGSQTTIPAVATTKNEIWNYTLKVFDGFDYSIQYNSSSVKILNSLPTVSDITITNNPVTTDDIVASFIFQDEDVGDSQVSFQIYWYKNNILQPALTTLTVLSSETMKNEAWNFTLTVFDGENNSIQYNSSITYIINSLPYITPLNPTFNKTNPTADDTINITYSYNDADNVENMSTDSEVTSSRIIYWYNKGAYEISKDNETILLNSETIEGDAWQYIIIVNDGSNYSLNYTSVIVFIGAGSNIIPTAENITLIANTNKTTEDLEGSYDYFDSDGLDVPSDIEIRWYANNILQSDLNDTLIVDSSFTTKNEYWNFTLRVYDGLNWSIQYNSSDIVILNSVPRASDLTITISPLTTDNISISWVFNDDDSNDIEISYNVNWYVNGIHNSTFDNMKEIDSIFTNKGEIWNYTLTVFDGDNNSIIYQSQSTTILNSIPLVWNLALTVNPTTTTDLFASWSAYDPDTVDSLIYNITWYRYGQLYQWWLTPSTSATLDSGNTTKNENWYFNVQAFDGESSSLIGAPSSNQQILNTPPVIQGGNVQINPGDPIRGTPLTVIYILTDADNDTETGTQIRWFKNNDLQSSFNDLSNIPGSEVMKGQVWHVEVLGGDGTSFSIPFNSTQIEIGNTAPEVEIKELFPTSPFTTNTLVASFDGSDVDSDLLVDFRIVWFNNSIEVPDLENNTEISPLHTKKGQLWKYQVSVYDGTDWSIPETFEPGVFVLNSKPYIENITITGGHNTSDDIILSYIFIDPDGDTEVSSDIDWTIFHLGSLVPGLPSTTTLINTFFTAGDLIYCTVQPNDGTENGDSVDSLDFEQYVFIGNSAPELVSQPNILNSDGFSAFFVNKDLMVNFTAMDPDQPDSDPIYWVDLDNFGYRWYQNGVLRSDLTRSIVLSTNLNKDDKWIVSVQPVDRFGDQGSWVNSSEITILNSKISISEVWFEDGSSGQLLINTTYANMTLFIGFDFVDADGDENPVFEILWYWNNGNGTFVLRADLGNQTREIFNLTKEHSWYIILRLFDGQDWSIGKNSSIIEIINSPPTITFWGYIFDNYDVEPSSRIDEFFVDDENLVIFYIFADFDNDPNNTVIRWFKKLENGIWLEMTEFENMTVVTSSNTEAGELWYASIIPHDGIDEGNPVNSSYINVFSRPSISDPFPKPELDMDGKYNLSVKVTDFSNPQTLVVTFQIITINSTKYNASYLGSGYWNLSVNLIEWLNTNVTVNVEAYSTIDSTFQILENSSFEFPILDKAPPRVTKISYLENKETNPTYIEFFIVIKESGSEIKEVILVYSFSSSLTGFGSQYDEEFSIIMNPVNSTDGISYYYVKLDLPSFDQDVILSYTVQTEDELGNRNPNAFSGERRLDFAPPGLSPGDLVVSLAILTALFLAIGSGYMLYRRKSEEKRSMIERMKAKLSFFSDTYMILVSSISGIPVWSQSNISYSSDEALEGTLSGLSVGIDAFLESFQSDFMSTLTNYDLTKDHPDHETNIRISVIEQKDVKIMILGSASYRIFVFMKETPSKYLRERFLEAIEDLQRKLPIQDLGFINENILGPNVRMVIKRHIPVGLLTPFKVDIERLNQLDSLQQQGLEDVHITKGGINAIKLLLIAARATELKNKNSSSLLRLYNKKDFAERYSGIFLFADAHKILEMIPGLSIEDICDAFWLGASEKVKILVPN
jgi:hypothetical protein